MRSLRQYKPVPLFPSPIPCCLSGVVQNFLVSSRTTSFLLKVLGGWLASSEAEITSTLTLSVLGGCH